MSYLEIRYTAPEIRYADVDSELPRGYAKETRNGK